MILVDVLIARNGITEELGEKALFSEIPDTRNTRRFWKDFGYGLGIGKNFGFGSGIGYPLGTGYYPLLGHFGFTEAAPARDYMPTGQQQRIHSRPTNMEGVYSNFNGRMCDCCSLIQILQSTLARFYDERMCPLHWTTATFSEQDDWSKANHLSHVWFFCNLALAEDNIMLSV